MIHEHIIFKDNMVNHGYGVAIEIIKDDIFEMDDMFECYFGWSGINEVQHGSES